MPKQTFFNLPESKRERITQAAIKEFAEYHFYDASINRIINKANVPRGSFYQYFEDLEDLYKYIVQIIAGHKVAYIERHYRGEGQGDIFTVLRNMYEVGLLFAKDHPVYAKISIRLIKGDKAFKSKIFGEWEEYTKQYIVDWLKKGLEEGLVREDIDLEVAAILLYEQSIALMDHFLTDMDGFDNLDRIMHVLDEMLKIFTHGIRS